MDSNRHQHKKPDPLRVVEASMELVDKDQLQVCPYDEVHVIRAKRFQYHLMKCRKNYSGNDMVKCPFNARHVIPRPEQRHHINTCIDKVLIEPETEYNTKMQNTDQYQGNISVPKYLPDREIPASLESWDEELDSSVDYSSYPQTRNTNGMLNYQPHPTSYSRPHEEPASLRQPRSQSASMVPPQQVYPVVQPSQPPPAFQPAQQVPRAANPSSWAHIAGIGRGVPRRTEEFPALPGSNGGLVPPPGFGRGHPGQRGPVIAANIYNIPQP